MFLQSCGVACFFRLSIVRAFGEMFVYLLAKSTLKALFMKTIKPLFCLLAVFVFALSSGAQTAAWQHGVVCLRTDRKAQNTIAPLPLSRWGVFLRHDCPINSNNFRVLLSFVCVQRPPLRSVRGVRLFLCVPFPPLSAQKCEKREQTQENADGEACLSIKKGNFAVPVPMPKRGGSPYGGADAGLKRLDAEDTKKEYSISSTTPL